MNGQELESVKSHPYLGVELTQSLNWNNHINNITTKANRSLGFIKRNLKRCPEQIKDQAYKSLVRPHLEYASSVWSPHQKYHVDKLVSTKWTINNVHDSISQIGKYKLIRTQFERINIPINDKMGFIYHNCFYFFLK